jgi:hypothetical protein
MDEKMNAINADISSIRNESKFPRPIRAHSQLTSNPAVKTLQTYRQLSETALLSNPRTRAHLPRAAPRRGAHHHHAAAAHATLDRAALAHAAAAHRSVASVTSFLVRASDPAGAPDATTTLLGLRVDASSARRGRFVAPWTLVFARDDEARAAAGAEGQGAPLRLVRHSVPAGAIALRAALRRCMPGAVGPRRASTGAPAAADDDDQADEDEEENDAGSGARPTTTRGKQDLGAFARELRRAMVGMVRREDAAADVRRQCEKRPGVRAGDAGPGGSREVEVTLEGVAVARLALADSGVVERAVVRDLAPGGDRGPRRRRMIEMAILARGGRAEGLVDRMVRAAQAAS